ncbi:GntR family transcriptional regulator [Paenibacillus roseipurpureus]|uniref:GntR family transcriptional regulator n=1 Tax=Paenibacillus roseopurpureus TaxID=2918901 RepID=A0AA96LLH7_9BACL|nr:GntR family transcriptional regulator [Paenibacillus sp. MBLB1832]WNR42806.1 GntR family transcriptional regulator [Paenibacillus sp. MBLB1832]
MQPIDRDIPVPLYFQIYQQLEVELNDGSRKPGDFYSTEMELQERFQVSRATIRSALTMLEKNGQINRITGKGIFLAPVKLKVDLPNLLSFSEEMKRRGMNPGTRLVEVTIVSPPQKVTTALSLKDNENTLLINRIRTGDHKPIVYSQSYLPLSLGLTPTFDFTGSLYELIQTQTGKAVTEAVHLIEGALVEGETADWLEVESGFPGLRFRRTAYDQLGNPLVYEEGMIRGDLYSYEIRLKKLPANGE